MAFFFLLVGLEIKREVLDGQLSSWSRRLLPGVAAAGGMIAPAIIYVAFNSGHPDALRGWAIPTATDIAFALGVLSLVGPRVPASLKIFLAALAILDDLGAVIVIAVFYTGGLSLPYLAGAAAIATLLIGLNRGGVTVLAVYVALGVVLWVLVLKSGVHATLAGVILAMTIPIRLTPGKPEATDDVSPLHKLEHALQKPVAFLVVPIFGFANAGVSFAGITPAVFAEPLSLGVALGLVVGKLIGVFGAVFLMVRSGVSDLPPDANWGQMLGVAFLCGIGFTMSLFIGLLAFDDPAIQDKIKLGILCGSLIAGLSGFAVLRFAPGQELGRTN
jgi:NhaA family Na+:H+ antiporter